MAFMRVYREMGVRDRESVPLEAICVKAVVSPLAILGAIFNSAKQMKGMESALKAIIAHPDVIDATVTTAKLLGPAGFQDRKMLNEVVGFLPTKQGSSIAINLGMGGAPDPKGDDEPDDDEQKFIEAFPSISGRLEEWSENRRLLTEGK